MGAKFTLYCFELEDMSTIAPFWQWFDKHIEDRWIYTVADDLDAILAGDKSVDFAKFLVIDKSKSAIEAEYVVPCTYDGCTADIITANAQRLSDHRFKIELSFWEPKDWPKKYLWITYNGFLKELCDAYPSAKRTLKKVCVGYDNFDDTREALKSAIVEDLSQDNGSSITQSSVKRIAPSRPGNLEKWKATWSYIQARHWLTMGMSPGKIREFLDKDHKRNAYHGTVFSVETIEKIIRAGQAGELPETS